MSQTLRILFVEDLPTDQELAERQLRSSNFQFESMRVDTRQDFLNALATFKPDLIISDYSMPGFDGMQALQLTKELYPELPFVVLTGSMNEDTAVECMKSGAADYVIKEHLNRLQFAVRDALKQAGDRKEKLMTEKVLQESESKFRSLFKNNHAIMLLIDPEEGDITDANLAACQYYGYSLEEISDKKITKINTLSINEVQAEMQKALSEERNYFNFRHRLANGEIRDVEVYSGPIQHMGKKLLYSIVHDVTDRKEAEKQLRKSEEKFRSLFHTNLSVMLLIDPETGAISDANQAACRFYGYEEKDLLKLNIANINNLPTEKLFMAIKQAMNNERNSFQFQHRLASGEIRDVEVNSSPIEHQGKRLLYSIVQDVTERVKAERALREGEQRYRNLFEESPVSIWEEDFSKVKRRLDELKADGVTDFYEYFSNNSSELIHISTLIDVIEVNQETIRLFGARNKDELRSSFTKIYTKQSLDQLIEELVNIAKGITNFDIDFTNRTLDGRVLEFSAKWSVMPGHANDLSKVLISMVDITERKKAEIALRENEERYRSLFDDSPVAIFEEDFSAVKIELEELKKSGVSDLKEYLSSRPDKIDELVDLIRILDVNQEAFKLFGYNSKDQFFVGNDQRPSSYDFTRMIDEFTNIANGITKFQKEAQRIKSNEEYQYLSINWTAVPGYEESLSKVIVTIVDITERKELEKRQIQRLLEMEAIDKITSALRQASTRDEALPIFLQETLAMMQENRGSILLYNAVDDTLQVTHVSGLAQEMVGVRIKPGKGTIGSAFQEGESKLIGDFKREFSFHEIYADHENVDVGGVCVPIQSLDNILGVVLIVHPKEREIKPDEIKMLESFARIAGITLQRMTLYEDTLIHLKQLQVQRTIDQTIASIFDLNLTLELICSQARNYLDANAVGILLFQPNEHMLNYIAGNGFQTAHYKNTKLPLSGGPAAKATLKREIVYVPDVHQSDPPFKFINFLKEERFVSYLAVPLIAKGEAKGVMEIFYRKTTDFDPDLMEFIESLAYQTAIAIDNLQLFENLQQSNQELVQAYDATIQGWSRAMDLRDKETENHTRRVTEMAVKIARMMKIKEDEIVHIRRGALLHDIGKMGVPDEILHKPGALTAEEWDIMKMHPVYAYEMIAPIEYLKPALDIPYCHHEKWDGSGYPRGLKGEEIPLAGRIFAVIDVWDALMSDRPYRKAWEKDRVIDYIKEQSGTHFDPEIVKVFLEIVQGQEWSLG